jgi:hypothetical protein
MKVRHVDGTEPAAHAVVLDVLKHAESAPEGTWTVHVGQRAAQGPDGALWLVQDDSVARVLPLSCSCEHVEVTEYQDGEETSRDVRREQVELP